MHPLDKNQNLKCQKILKKNMYEHSMFTKFRGKKIFFVACVKKMIPMLQNEFSRDIFFVFFAQVTENVFSRNFEYNHRMS